MVHSWDKEKLYHTDYFALIFYIRLVFVKMKKTQPFAESREA